MSRRSTFRLTIVGLVSFAMACSARWACHLDPSGAQFAIAVLSNGFVSSRIAGVLHPLGGEEWLESNEPTLIVWKHPSGPVTELRVGSDGRFFLAVPPGNYCFRASARSFTTLAGRITVRKSAPAQPIELRLAVAN